MSAAKALDFFADDSKGDERSLQEKAERATVYVGRSTVRAVLMRELKSYGIKELKFAESPEECIEDLTTHPESLLVIDWECGEQKVTKVLRAAQGPQRVDTRPIYFIALEVSERVIVVANEFNVAQVQTGEISQEQIVKNLDELLVFSVLSPVCQEAFRAAADFRKAGDWFGAADALKIVCIAEPDNLRAAVEYGYSLCESGDIDEAEKWLGGVIKRFPTDLRAKHLLARCAMKKGRFVDAQELLREASLISPYNVDRLVDLGRILLNLNQVDQALGQFDKALRLDKDLEEAKIGKAQCRMLGGHLNEAMKLLTQLQSEQEIASVFNGAAILAVRQQNFRQGLSLYRSACGFLRKDNIMLARVLFNMGVGLLKWGKGEAAQLAFEHATTLDPGLIKARHNLSVLTSISLRSEARAIAQSEELETFDTARKTRKASQKLAKAEGEEDGEIDEELGDRYFQSLITRP